MCRCTAAHALPTKPECRHQRQRESAHRGAVCMPQSVPKVPYRNPKDRRIQWVEIFNVLVRLLARSCLLIRMTL